MGFPSGMAVKNPPAKAGDTRDAGLILGLVRSSGVGNGNPLRYSCPLQYSMDRGAWKATVHGVAKSWTQLSNIYTHTHKHKYMFGFIAYSNNFKIKYLIVKKELLLPESKFFESSQCCLISQ